MAKWLNRVVIAAPRNATTTHTVDPNSGTAVAGTLFTPTAGNFLVCVAEGAVTSTTPSGWTLPSGGSAINNTGLYIWHRTAASGTNQFTTTHNGADYPVAFAFYEFAAGTTFVSAVAATNVGNSGVSSPTLSGLTGTNLIMCATAQPYPPGTNPGNMAWTPGVEDFDIEAIFGTTDGYHLSLAYLEDSVLTSASFSATNTGVFLGHERIVFAVKVAAGGGSNTGTLSTAVPRPTSSIAGTSRNSGTFNASTLSPISTVVGTSTNPGTFAVSVPRTTALLVESAASNTGTFSAAAPRATATITGASTNPGTTSGSTPQVTASILGASTNPGTLVAGPPRVTGSVTGQSTNPGSGLGSTPRVTTAFTATATNIGTFNVAAPRVTASLVDTSVVAGALAASTPRATSTFTGQSVNSGTFAASAPRVSSAVAGFSVVPGTFNASTPAPTSLLTGTSVNSGSVATATRPLVATLAGALRNPGALSGVLFVPTMHVNGTLGAPLPLVDVTVILGDPYVAVRLGRPHLLKVQIGPPHPLAIALGSPRRDPR